MQKIAGVAGVFESLSDNISVGLFTAIAHERINSVVLRNKVKIPASSIIQDYRKWWMRV
jgi:hypothetical protein